MEEEEEPRRIDVASTGYLEDAVMEFRVRFKRQPQSSSSISSCAFSNVDEFGLDHHHFNLWTETCSQTTNLHVRAEENNSIEEAITIPTMKRAPNDSREDSPIRRYRCSSTESSSSSESSKTEAVMRWRRRRRSTRVAYPFATVKPRGIDDGDLTLDHINKRIKMAPSRAVRHPVGDYASRPCVVSPHGPGLSGKAVVALTRIHTRGRGTITIMRPKA